MRIIYTILLLIVLVISFANAQWQQINSGLPGNPGTLWVRGLATDGQYIYAGVSTFGVYRSSDKGNNWISVNNGLPNRSAWEIYSNNDTLFVGFLQSRAFRSTDQGNTWDTMYVGSNNSSSVRGFISNNKYLFAATWGNGIFRSSDGGANWAQINNGLNSPTFWDIFSIEDTLLAANYGGGIYRSTNNGDNWAQSNNGLTASVAYRLAALGNYIFVGTANNGIFRSSDFGINWTQVGLTSLTINALLAYDTLIFAGTASAGVFISHDYGTTWEEFNDGNILGNIQELIYDDTYLYAATAGSGVYRYDKNNITSIENTSTEIPTSFSLEQNYPNPFNPSTSIQYAIGSSQFVTLKVFDVLGKEVATLVDEYKPAGTYEVEFNVAQFEKNGSGPEITSGIYFYQLKAGDFIQTKKMILIK
ncbi:MAG: T9SS type A sorting domain-containing protein [Ignavibacterium sp.]|nr:T9SS type A sorting domain-containing protein [Ignavibacterium sp.]